MSGTKQIRSGRIIPLIEVYEKLAAHYTKDFEIGGATADLRIANIYAGVAEDLREAIGEEG